MLHILIYFYISLLFINCIKYEEYDENKLKIEDIFEPPKNNTINSNICLPTDDEVKDFINNNKINYKGTIDKNVKFIAGNCNPIVLIPGIYSTKLNVKINCRNLKREENSLYEKIKFFCSKYVCSSDIDEEENRDLWFNFGGKGFSLLRNFYENQNSDIDEDFLEDLNKNNRYGACLGFFMTIFDNKDECPIIESSKKRIC